MKPLFLFCLIWIVSVGLSFWAGTQLSEDSQPANPQVKGLNEEKPNAAKQIPKKKVALPSVPNPLPPSPESIILANGDLDAVDQTEFLPNLRRAMEGGGLVERLGSYLDAVRAMDSGNSQLVLAAFEALPKGYGRHLEMKLLMRSWATFDPVSALAYANEKLDARSERRFAVAEALAEWASRDSKAALDWAKAQNEDQLEDNPLLAGVIKGVAEKNLEEAAKMFLELPPGSARWQSSHHLVQKFVEKGLDETIAWANQIPRSDKGFRDNLLGQIGAQIAKNDPIEAAKWADTLETGDARNRIISTVLGQWVSRAPDEASQWASKIEDPSTRSHAMTQMANYWSVRDPVATAEWLNNFPPSKDMDPVVGAFVTRISGRDPEGAVGWAMSIVDEKKKATALNQALTAWRRVDKQAADKWSNANAPQPSQAP